MTVCPRQHKRDIIAQTSRLRVLRCHTQRLSQELSPWLLVTSENVSRHQWHRNDHRYTSGHCTAESRLDWPDAPGTLPPLIHQRASTSCKSIPPPSPRSHRDAGSMAPESWADDWVTVSGRSPDPVH